MSKSSNIPFALRQQAAKFRRQRAEYYKYVADLLDGGNGDIKILSIFEKDAVRRGATPRAKLSAYWAERFSTNGANLAEAWQGTLPDDEVAIIHVAQTAGPGALNAALRDVARMAALTDRVRRGVIGTLSAAVFGLAIATLMLTVFPVVASQKLQSDFAVVPVEYWGPRGKFMIAWAQGVLSYGFYVVLMLIVGAVYFQWTFNNLIGPAREWLDTRIAVYRVARDVKGALFLATMATLTRRRGNTMFTLSQSLATFARSVRSPWLRWRVEQIADGVDRTGAIGTSAFETNLLSKDMYYFLVDMYESQGFAAGFEATGRYVENSILDSILRRMQIYRWVMLGSCVAVVVGVAGAQMNVIYEMKTAMTTYYGSR
ncbi:MAG: hypothetical protein WA159_17890 [Variovorax sp.]